jgi:NADPH:quinone reductase-like Zn-dependent oxidoreductase
VKAIVQNRYGSADVLALGDVEAPSPGDDDVLIEVGAAGVDPSVWHLMTGLPLVMRLGLGLRAPRSKIRGRDVAGRVAAVGSNVTRFAPGDMVFGTCDGSFAEFACARQKTLAHAPANLSVEESAAVPTSACTALHGLRDAGKVRAGQRALIIGAGGGIGTFAVQLAKVLGAEATGVCGTSKVDLVRDLGADHVIDYTRADFADGSSRYDVILDTAGNRPLSHLRRALSKKGTLVIIGGEGKGRWLGMGRQARALMVSPFLGQTFRAPIVIAGSEDLLMLKELIEAGEVRPIVTKTFRLAEAPTAIREWERGHTAGKLVISLSATT